MPLVIQTARISYRGDDRLDVTAKSAPPHAKAFAPTWKLVNWGLKMRGESRKRLAGAHTAYEVKAAISHREWSWKMYSMRYRAQLDLRYKKDTSPWDEMLKRERVVFVCYCTEADHCHRRVLAQKFVELGATYIGEVSDALLPESEEQETLYG